MSGNLIHQVAIKDTELLDWVETEVIALNQHPKGWEIWYRAEDNEPATPDPVFYETRSFREACARAKADQESAIAAAAESSSQQPLPDITDSQMRFCAAGRMLDGVEWSQFPEVSNG